VAELWEIFVQVLVGWFRRYQVHKCVVYACAHVWEMWTEPQCLLCRESISLSHRACQVDRNTTAALKVKSQMWPKPNYF